MEKAVPARLRLAATSFVFLAILLQALLPAGFMPSLGKGKAFQVEICTAYGLRTITLETKDKKHEEGAHRETCPYAPVLPLLLTAPQGAAAAVVARAAALTGLRALLPPRLAVKPWFSQGPPASLHD